MAAMVIACIFVCGSVLALCAIRWRMALPAESDSVKTPEILNNREQWMNELEQSNREASKEFGRRIIKAYIMICIIIIISSLVDRVFCYLKDGIWYGHNFKALEKYIDVRSTENCSSSWIGYQNICSSVGNYLYNLDFCYFFLALLIILFWGLGQGCSTLFTVHCMRG